MPQEAFAIPETTPQIGGIYVHYRNKEHEYKVTGVSLNSDSHEWYVEYIPLYEGAVAPKFNRSFSVWFDRPIVDGKEVERYTFVRMG
jgi:hypothetical protein